MRVRRADCLALVGPPALSSAAKTRSHSAGLFSRGQQRILCQMQQPAQAELAALAEATA